MNIMSFGLQNVKTSEIILKVGKSSFKTAHYLLHFQKKKGRAVNIYILDFFNTLSFVKVFNTLDSFMEDFPNKLLGLVFRAHINPH